MVKTTKKSDPKKLKDKRKYGNISREEIVTAALKIAKRDGATALSMRSLAAELNVSPMAAYYYVPSKKALTDLVMDKIYSDTTTSVTSGSPEDRLRAMFRLQREGIRQNPGLAPLLLSAAGHKGKELRRLRQELKDLFTAAGYSDRYTAAAFLLIALFEYGALMLEAGYGVGVAAASGYENIEQNLDDGLSLIFAGMKTFGDREQAERRQMQGKGKLSASRARSAVRVRSTR